MDARLSLYFSSKSPERQPKANPVRRCCMPILVRRSPKHVLQQLGEERRQISKLHLPHRPQSPANLRECQQQSRNTRNPMKEKMGNSKAPAEERQMET
mmetsp:Transcript_48304/g.88401  ORF Transcript_48304/g.88401 Transcript_48304/m.88401 type:complete len:98 (+) Transcript_48304:66-359(+)